MKEVTFLDRVPTYPGRVVLTPVSGQANTFDMVRADAPRVDGTPMDKATFESVVHSRLTGRFYTVQLLNKTAAGNVTATNNPIPTSGWIDVSETRSTNGSYELLASGTSRNYGGRPYRAADGDAATYWASYAPSDGEKFITIRLPEAISVSKMSVHIARSNENYDQHSYVLFGSADDTNWTTLATFTAGRQSAVSVTISQPARYRYYKIAPATVGQDFAVFDWKISEYQTPTYANAFAVSDGWPAAWSEGQRATIQIPASVSTLAVVSNTLNGITVNTILQPNRRYELRYTGTQFIATEV